MPGGRPPKPLALHVASGAVKKNPQRFRDRAPEPAVTAKLGPPPEAWVKAAVTSPENAKLVAAWKRLADRIALLPEGVVTGADDILVGLTCRVLVRVESGYPKPGDAKELRSLLSELGLTPTGRARQQGPRPTGDPDHGDFGEFTRTPARRTA